jgi:sulfate adenylyltransferase subunit 2
MENLAVKLAGSHLSWLESESIHILREAVAENSMTGLRAFYPAKPPFPLLHVDSTWEFRSLIAFRDDFAAKHGFKLIAYANEKGRAAGINPFDHGDHYTLVMRTEPLKSALDEGGYDIIFGGARRDEEKSRIVSVRGAGHSWDPRQQRPELWRLYNTRLGKDQTARVFPLSNWTETDIWAYALLHKIELAPLYFAAPRPVVHRAGSFIVVDDESRMRFQPGDEIQSRTVRFRTLGCWPVTGAIESEATELAAVDETLRASSSERQGRISDGEDGGSLEQKKREGYF